MIRGSDAMTGEPVLVVDAANVVGSLPDGWWRDRAGAARRLHRALAAAALPYAETVLVLEGRARDGVPEGTSGRLRVVHAPASGDDTLVDECRAGHDAAAQVTLATADRGLIARLEALGVRVIGPRGLREEIGL